MIPRPGDVIYDEAASFSLASRNSTSAADQLEADVARLGLIRQARDRGIPWAAIATALGYPSGREAKRHAHRLHATTRRAWYLHRNQEDG